MNPGRSTKEACEAAENRHHRKTQLLRYRILREDGATLAGTSDMAAAQRILAVLSRDGELDGYAIVARGRA